MYIKSCSVSSVRRKETGQASDDELFSVLLHLCFGLPCEYYIDKRLGFCCFPRKKVELQHDYMLGPNLKDKIREKISSFTLYLTHPALQMHLAKKHSSLRIKA